MVAYQELLHKYVTGWSIRLLASLFVGYGN